MQTSAEKIWVAAREQLRSMLTGDTYNLWFAPLRAASQESNHLTLEVANDFCEVWLKDNYLDLIEEVIALPSARQPRAKSGGGQGGAPSAPHPQAISAKAKLHEPAA